MKWAIILAIAGGGASLAAASPGPSDLCRQAVEVAAQQSGVPYDVLLAVSLTETGRQLRPGGPLQAWPWARNQAGNAQWFASQPDAVADAENLVAQGVSNLDLGCFQLNYRWHSMNFPSIDAMFDPLSNALYAAQLLSEHYRKTGDWAAAVGAYHSANPETAARYLERFDRIYAGLSAGETDDQNNPVPQIIPVAASSPNNFPLLRLGSRASGPSLFPSGSTGLAPTRRLIGE